MRVGMGLIKNEHGVFHVRRKVPKALEVATARAMGVPKERVSWLKETLGTKDEKQAKVLAKPVMMKFDRILAEAEALLVEHPVRTELTEAEINQIADYFYAHQLGADEGLREEGIGSDPVFASVHRQLAEAGIEFETPFEVTEETGSGLSARMMHKIEEDASIVLLAAKEALARGNVNFIRYDLNELLQIFRINLDPTCASYRKVALAVIKAWVRALEDVRARNRGALIDSPKLIEPSSNAPVSNCSLRAAYEGWDKMEQRPISTRMEFSRGIDRFIELHGDLDVAKINRGHVRAFRDDAQLVPKRRTGKLRKAPLPELAKWSREHPGTVCIGPATINKWLTCLQGVLNWARKNGVIPDEIHWTDPVAGMRLKVPRSKRRPWEPGELSVLFGSPIYTQGARPKGGKGEAAYWLPLLALYSGARLNELAPMCANDVKMDHSSGAYFMTVIEDEEAGRSVKTEASISAVSAKIEALLDEKIEGVAITAPIIESDAAGGRVDLSAIDFEKLAQMFASRPRTAAEKLRSKAEAKAHDMAAKNPTRVHLVEKLEKLVEEYNLGTLGVEAFFEALKALVATMEEEERRAAREGLSEDELAVFDLLTKPKPKLTKTQEAAVKKVARELLEKLQDQLSVDAWQTKQQTRAAVQHTIRFTLNELPEEPYPEPVWNEKVNAVWAFIFARRQAQSDAPRGRL